MTTIYNTLKYYVLFCVFIVPFIANERTELPTESQPEILFWCECGVKEHWKIRPLKKLN